jgi:hypothetical protein
MEGYTYVRGAEGQKLCLLLSTAGSFIFASVVDAFIIIIIVLT